MNLTLATWDHDRVMPLHDGRVTVPGVTFESHILPTGKLFPLAVQEAKFDITELSVSSYVLQVSRGDSAYTAIPAFVSRAFRHSGFFARQGSEIETLADLAGKRVGVPEYQMTAALWMRGLLADEYGVDPAGIHWRTGALDQGVRHERLALELPEGMVVEPIADGETLQELLLDARIDGLLAPNPPKTFLAGDPRIRRIIPDFGAAERAYHAKTGYFPIMHLIAVRKSLVAQNPDLPAALLSAFTEARDIALNRLREVWLGSANRLSLPWLNEAMEATIGSMGTDYWPYGFDANRAELDTICRYSVEQYLAARRVAPEELFPESVR
ncbi:PhnD/SsuA/transferrin family substrate-binding protein [Aestuariicoccus sp. MJ-SS9]|uniref:PhnD/SsuA/transferrin family substrate-binding protein n=1 Tax=Aestuariicoccus sp. MJ-SS9 TaxID=3079855 RepID=UPI00290A2420|nr:PhnD/SsuA/transferrin family substrate-binding protein [Aestuariicoccus sp. MJ-SS9]MDU8911924.1 4,5-dihydroxyphthalate decarboxylase [Aestuariicoccus sp. MJ-SS9]